jgi:hypothetical protein
MTRVTSSEPLLGTILPKLKGSIPLGVIHIRQPIDVQSNWLWHAMYDAMNGIYSDIYPILLLLWHHFPYQLKRKYAFLVTSFYCAVL